MTPDSNISLLFTSLSLLLLIQPVISSATTTVSPPATTPTISQRIIYEFHPVAKTWNVARDICESRQGQLVKFESLTQEHEIYYLVSQKYATYMQNSPTIWTGGHVNDSSELVYQDCLPATATTIPAAVPGPDVACVAVQLTAANNFFYDYDHCSITRKFVCQRTIGDCWFMPHEEYTVLGDSFNLTLNTTETTYCALACRNQLDSDGFQCWAFTFYKNLNKCVLHFLGPLRFNKAPSVTYLLGDNDYLLPMPDVILYLRICFEGEVDHGQYESFTDTSSDPDIPKQDCSRTDPDPADQLCFCESTEDPPIPEPIPVADKIEELVKELSIDTGNTSAALRKKTSAEDNRPSAQGVGYMGAGMMGTVFGGLFLLDVQGMVQGIVKIIKAIKGNA